jgi:aspartyl-tRNA(Asn)/glutamyl-tRNA(Gln) amidotransferase subunit A
MCLTHPDPRCALRDDVAQALTELARELGASGFIEISGLAGLTRRAEALMFAEAASVHLPALRRGAPRSALVRNVAVSGAVMPVAWYIDALSARPRHIRAFADQVFADADIVLTPALPGGVPDAARIATASAAFEPRQLLDLFSWMPFVNYLDLPALVAPIGRDGQGRPISVQALARPGAERLLLAFAGHVQERRGHAYSHFN